MKIIPHSRIHHEVVRAIKHRKSRKINDRISRLSRRVNRKK